MQGFKTMHCFVELSFVCSGYVELFYEMIADDMCILHLVPSEDLNKIFVKVYDVDEAVPATLDDFKDAPDQYVRIKIYIHPAGFAHLYIAHQIPKIANRIIKGDYLKYARTYNHCRYLLENNV